MKIADKDDKETRLKVAEAMPDDVNKGIVRIDHKLMKELGLREGDIVEIEGTRKTVGIVDRALPGDIGLDIIRMDGLIRRNAKSSLGELITARKTEIKEAAKVILAPAKQGVMIRAPPDMFKQGLLGRAAMKGDIMSFGGTRTRRKTMGMNPLFDEIFSSVFEDAFNVGFGFGDLKFVVVDTSPKGAVIITENTEVVLNPEAVELEKEKELPDVTYEDIGGLDEEIKKIREMVELPLKHPEIFERLGIEPPKGVLLHGPPGTGKTLLAKAVASETNANFVLINGPEIMSKYYGQSEENLRKKFEEAEANAPSIIFIDEIDAIAVKREEVTGEVEKRVVAQLLGIMDGLKSRGKVIVIAASNIPNALDPALRRPGRFDREIEIGVPGKVGRLNILKIHTRNMPLKEDVKLEELVDVTYGFVGADLASLCKEAAMIVIRRVLPDIDLKSDHSLPKDILQQLVISKQDFQDALKVVRPSAMREILVEVPDVSWEDIGGLDNVKQELKEAVEWPLKTPEAFTRMGITPPKGILLYGPPGAGKTMLAKAIANESDANFISIKGPELLSKWVGESEKAVRKIFQKARQLSPAIIFFDEIDSIVPKRGMSADSGVTERVVNQLLTEIDGLVEMKDVVVIAATNRPDMVDPALLRPGRFDRLLLVQIPDEAMREKIFKLHTTGMPLKGVDLKKLAKETEGYVGADIETISREAGILALRKDIKAKEITQANFDEALTKVRPSVDAEAKVTYDQLEAQLRSAKAHEIKQHVSYFG
ncbi:CDC48 family AAA ATPase [Candidatus Woesearchaeota archaeon]|nr:CDC48 family AAA ATPase [Candidatus Woesearchaeota archaeon]